MCDEADGTTEKEGCGGGFDSTAPRPPVPGECVSDWGEGEAAAAKGTASSGGSPSPPACLEWARSLHCLLQDPNGLELFYGLVGLFVMTHN